MAIFPHPVLLCDIGGTNVRLSEAAEPGAKPSPPLHSATHEHASLADAVRAAQPRLRSRARSLIVCAAGPFHDRRLKLTNADWTIDGPETAKSLGLDQGLLLNDFEAQAIMLPSLASGAAVQIGAGPAFGPETQGPQLVLGPGTGLGAALLIPWKDRFMPLPTEAGHMDFGPSDAFESKLWEWLPDRKTRITGEYLLSGDGLVRLYTTLCGLEHAAARTAVAKEISDFARADRDGPEARALRLFWKLVARYSGNLALGVLATGGVTLSGGILPQIADFVDHGEFQRVFADTPPLGDLVSRIPVRLVTDQHAVLAGLGTLAAHPDRFMIDYAARVWR